MVSAPTMIRRKADHPTAKRRAPARRTKAVRPRDPGLRVVGRPRLQRAFAGEKGVTPSGEISRRHAKLA